MSGECQGGECQGDKREVHVCTTIGIRRSKEVLALQSLEVSSHLAIVMRLAILCMVVLALIVTQTLTGTIRILVVVI